MAISPLSSNSVHQANRHSPFPFTHSTLSGLLTLNRATLAGHLRSLRGAGSHELEDAGMPRKHYKPEEIVAKLRQVDVSVSQGRSVADAVRAIGVTEVTYYLYGRLSHCESILK